MNIGDVLVIGCDKAPLWVPMCSQNVSSMWIELKVNDVVLFLESRRMDGFGNLKLNYFKVMMCNGIIGWVWEKNIK